MTNNGQPPDGGTGPGAMFGFTGEQVDAVAESFLVPRHRRPYEREVREFLARCEALGLSPFRGEIIATYRAEGRSGEERMGVQTLIDGLRLIAERTGRYAGQLTPLFCGPEGEWTEVWGTEVPPHAAKARLQKLIGGRLIVTEAVALFDEYAERFADSGRLKNQWAEMPTVMAAKCAEAQALRKAFPGAGGQLYIPEEIAHSLGSEESEQLEALVRQAERLAGEYANGHGAPNGAVMTAPADGAAAAEDRAASAEPEAEPEQAGIVAHSAGPERDRGAAPADPARRRELKEAMAASGFAIETLKELCRFYYGHTISERLGERELGDLAARLGAIKAGAISEGTLKGQLTKAFAKEDPEAARKLLDQWILRRANEAASAASQADAAPDTDAPGAEAS
jgi:phage recombination protein Bet